MYINYTNLSNVPVGTNPTRNSGAPKSADAADDTSNTSTHSPSPELAHFLNLVHQEPEVRAEVVQRVAQKLANGDYLTPEAADKTAEAMLNQEVPSAGSAG